MKITNYNRGYQPWADCSIHGTIYLTQTEWREKVLPYYNRMRNKQCEWSDYRGKNYFLFSLGVTATEKIVKKFNLKGYKPQNYQFMISRTN